MIYGLIVLGFLVVALWVVVLALHRWHMELADDVARRQQDLASLRLQFRELQDAVHAANKHRLEDARQLITDLAEKERRAKAIDLLRERVANTKRTARESKPVRKSRGAALKGRGRG
jgi:hypothetical protein